ncbi:MAG: YhcH/YjgK/YiaL family protein [Bacteroidales bacterium]|nr:YhcH/YjgK/YiaL family protein [Bacteroidales bacterium]
MIKFLVMDVDGTLTDGKVYLGNEGESFKAFDIKDGFGIKTLLPQNGIIPIIITARKSVMLEHRCKELNVNEVHQGIRNKVECLNGIINRYSSSIQSYTLANCAYIGDDILDLQCLLPIKEAGGLAGCPADAVQSVKQACDYIAPHKAGEGAVRDYIEYIIVKNENGYERENLKERLDEAVDIISNLDFLSLEVGTYIVSPNFYYTVQEYTAFDEDEAQYESHRKYIDIQWVYEGEERLMITDIGNLVPSGKYDEDKDLIIYNKANYLTSMILVPGSCAILFPKDAHKPTRFLGKACKIKKVVGKLRIEVE